MQIPRHWAKASLPCDFGGRSGTVSCWRGSTRSDGEALARAQEAVRRAVDAIQAGKGSEPYGYRDDTLREEILEELPGTGGEPVAILTRNRYGAEILNAEGLFFADLDLKPLSFWKRLPRLFGRPVLEPEEAALERLRRFSQVNGSWSFRVYRTFNGLRVMAPHAPQDPQHPFTVAVQEALGSDRLFIRLCRFQKSFRARLSPKPWRLGLPRPGTFPREGAEAEGRFQQWLATYLQASQAFATCRFVETIGSGRIDPVLAPVVRLHDERTGALSSRPLA